ncbi:putative bifunctional diguanylate cyclase/phosphodiesterase [Novosphingobium ovatum]|nr:EAL domain-containing protein [Novosphingobium ovatum]
MPQLYLAAYTLSAVALLRVAASLILPRLRNTNARVLEFIYELGAYSYSTAIGMMATLTVLYKVPPVAETLMVANAIGYAVGIAARNAGRPAIAIGQMILTLTPVCIALAMRSEIAAKVLAFSITLLLPAMTSITMNVFKTLRDSISAAETSQRLADKMQHLARTDVVTGLHNRAGLNHQLVEKLMDLEPGRRLALFWLDLDKFKEVNDTLGHQVGDRLLCEVAARLRKQSPADACIARFGGDEFIIACEADAREDIQRLADELLAEIIRPIRIDNDRLEVGCSIGIAVLPDDGTDLETVLQGADLALFQSKVNGRKQVTFFDAAMTRALVRRREIEAELRLALQRDELSVFFQPLIDLNTGRIRAFETLVRWFHPEKGELRPDEFIPVAEECGAIITLGNWITAQAAKVAATWPDHVTLAVNLSPLQIKAPGAALGILNALREAKLDPTRLELEITETVLLEHSPNTDAFIKQLSEAGVRFALDDFGTGYSSLGYLDKYPFKKIKIDRSFVSGINVGTTSTAIIRAVSGMGQSLGMEIVAEGLETLEQVQAVRQAGCTLGQGWYFSRAVPDYLAAMLLAQEARRFDEDTPAAIETSDESMPRIVTPPATTLPDPDKQRRRRSA